MLEGYSGIKELLFRSMQKLLQEFWTNVTWMDPNVLAEQNSDPMKLARMDS